MSPKSLLRDSTLALWAILTFTTFAPSWFMSDDLSRRVMDTPDILLLPSFTDRAQRCSVEPVSFFNQLDGSSSLLKSYPSSHQQLNMDFNGLCPFGSLDLVYQVRQLPSNKIRPCPNIMWIPLGHPVPDLKIILP